MEYPRRIVLTDEKLKKLVEEKNELILEGRKVSEDIEAVRAEMDEIDKEITAIEAKADVSDLKAKAEDLTNQMNGLYEAMKATQQALYDRLKSVVPPEMGEKYEAKKKEKDELESKIKKIALKVGQKKDKIIPRARKLMKAYLEDEFDDFDTIRMENGELVATIFNHVDDFKKNFKKRN